MREPYPYIRRSEFEYKFTSHGKKRIEKIATFIPAPDIDAFSFAFGYQKIDGTIDVYINSNNGDMYQELATLICIIRHFLDEHPETTVFFTGSTTDRDILYHRNIKINYLALRNEFKITVLIQKRNGLREVPFDPDTRAEFRGFYIQKIN